MTAAPNLPFGPLTLQDVTALAGVSAQVGKEPLDALLAGDVPDLD